MSSIFYNNEGDLYFDKAGARAQYSTLERAFPVVLDPRVDDHGLDPRVSLAVDDGAVCVISLVPEEAERLAAALVRAAAYVRAVDVGVIDPPDTYAVATLIERAEWGGGDSE